MGVESSIKSVFRRIVTFNTGIIGISRQRKPHYLVSLIGLHRIALRYFHIFYSLLYLASPSIVLVTDKLRPCLLFVSPAMAPIRIGILGLSPGSWSATSHLPYLQSPDSKFEIVAVCNSSRESALRSINKFNLGRNTRAYENAQGTWGACKADALFLTYHYSRAY